ncbi:MAG: hypothetical protein KGJ95_10460 [Candidatus Omnitrophica bacterium]|nr:hypothetical protein [Candidatus Omnitrophota bacterium]
MTSDLMPEEVYLRHGSDKEPSLVFTTETGVKYIRADLCANTAPIHGGVMSEEQCRQLVSAVWKEMALEAIKRETILSAEDEVFICVRALRDAGCLNVATPEGNKDAK